LLLPKSRPPLPGFADHSENVIFEDEPAFAFYQDELFLDSVNHGALAAGYANMEKDNLHRLKSPKSALLPTKYSAKLSPISLQFSRSCRFQLLDHEVLSYQGCLRLPPQLSMLQAIRGT